MNNPLHELYDKLNILNVPLHLKCPKCNICWPEPDDKEIKPDSAKELFIYYPWIGNKYENLRLLVLGINMNQDSGEGDILKQINYVRQAKEEILEGKQRLLRSKGYSGTIYWHRLPSYISVLLEKENIISLSWHEDFPSKENIAEAFEYSSITNIIKCSPNQDNNRGTPTFSMWKTCSEFVLKEELKILLPNIILILGLDSYTHYKENIFDIIPTEIASNNSFKKGKGLINNLEIEFYIIIHPTASGENAGSRRSLMLEFNEFLYKDKVDEIKSGLNLIAHNNDIDIVFFKETFGRGDSGFHFYNKNWTTNISIGFGFDESWGRNLFYGIYKRNKLNPDVINKIRKGFVIGPDSNQSENFPLWFWFYENEDKSKNIFVNMDMNLFLVEIELKLVQMLNWIKGAQIEAT